MIWRNLSKRSCYFVSIGLVLFLTACDQLLQDPGKILYRPEVLEIEDSSGKHLKRLPVPGPGQTRIEARFPLNKDGKPVRWGDSSNLYKDLPPFDPQEIPYLGGDNCLNSVFFDLIGIPVTGEKPGIYQKDSFYKLLQVRSEGPEHYFFLNDHLFLREHTYPYFLREGKSIVGNETLSGGADPAIDRFYKERMDFYRMNFQNQAVSYKILCDYAPTELGRVKENLLLYLFEDEDTIHFLADKQVHYLTRKDSVQRFVSEFSFSKAFLREGLQFGKN